jgi:AcrR family transcriptional regulator
MGCSTMPIYSHFKNMQALEDEVVKKAWKRVMNYQAERYTGDVWIDQGIGYVRFARNENNLFKCMLNGHNMKLRHELHRHQWQYLADNLKDYDAFKGLDEEQRIRLRYSRAMLSHGVAMSPDTGLNKVIVENDNLLADFLSTVSQALLKGYEALPAFDDEKRRFIEEEIKRMADHQQ